MRYVIVIGAGGHGKVVAAAIRARGDIVAAIFDDDETLAGRHVLGIPVLAPLARIRDQPSYDGAVIGVGDNRARASLAERLDLFWLSVVHPTAWIDPSCRIGPGAVVCAGAVVQPDTELGEHVIVNTGASVDHDCVVGSFAHLAPGVRLAGSVRIGSGALLGIGSNVTPSRTVGAWSTVGAGAAVTADIPDGRIALGVPARTLEARD